MHINANPPLLPTTALTMSESHQGPQPAMNIVDSSPPSEERFNEWYTPAEFLDTPPRAPGNAPWFHNFGSSSALLAHMHPRQQNATDPTTSISSDDSTKTQSSSFSGRLRAKLASSTRAIRKSQPPGEVAIMRRSKLASCFCAGTSQHR